jgi:hypothetical protein
MKELAAHILEELMEKRLTALKIINAAWLMSLVLLAVCPIQRGIRRICAGFSQNDRAKA